MRFIRFFSLPLAVLFGLVLAAVPLDVNLRGPAGVSLAKAEAAPAAKSKRKATRKKTPRKRNVRRSGRSTTKAAAAAPKIDPQHVAPEIVEQAAKKSPLELLSDYQRTAQEGDLETAAVLLKIAAQKPVTDVLVGEVNVLLGVPLDSQDAAALVEISGTARAAVIARHVAPENVPPPLSARLEHAHSATAALNGAAIGSPIERLSAYKRAVTHGNLPAAIAALSAAVGKPADDGLIAFANHLLRIEIPEERAEELARLADARVLAF